MISRRKAVPALASAIGVLAIATLLTEGPRISGSGAEAQGRPCEPVARPPAPPRPEDGYPPVTAGGAEAAIRQRRDAFVSAARSSLLGGNPADPVQFSVSFPSQQGLEAVLAQARGTGASVLSVLHGFRGSTSYFSGELPAVDPATGRPLSPGEVTASMDAMLRIQLDQVAKLRASVPEDPAAERAASDVQARVQAFRSEGIPLVALRAKGTRGQALAMQAARPDAIVALARLDCRRPGILMPPEADEIRPAASSMNTDNAPPVRPGVPR